MAQRTDQARPTQVAGAPAERFQPVAHVAPDTVLNRILFTARLAGDFQLNTIHRHMRRFLSDVSGTVVDVGAGQSPYRHLLDRDAARYVGLDIDGAAAFGYDNPEIVRFDGVHIPFDTASVDAVFCTEVLEHVEHAQVLVDEIHRVVRPGGRVLVTVPWSARYHYVPHDYHRFTPSRLANMFAGFRSVTVEPRGNDITAIVSKLVVVYARLLRPGSPWRLALSLVFAVPLMVAVAIGHASLHLRWGSTDDPLGYTVWATR